MFTNACPHKFEYFIFHRRKEKNTNVWFISRLQKISHQCRFILFFNRLSQHIYVALSGKFVNQNYNLSQNLLLPDLKCNYYKWENEVFISWKVDGNKENIESIFFLNKRSVILKKTHAGDFGENNVGLIHFRVILLPTKNDIFNFMTEVITYSFSSRTTLATPWLLRKKWKAFRNNPHGGNRLQIYIEFLVYIIFCRVLRGVDRKS